jgi:hypothetical protein
MQNTRWGRTLPLSNYDLEEQTNGRSMDSETSTAAECGAEHAASTVSCTCTCTKKTERAEPGWVLFPMQTNRNHVQRNREWDAEQQRAHGPNRPTPALPTSGIRRSGGGGQEECSGDETGEGRQE